MLTRKSVHQWYKPIYLLFALVVLSGHDLYLKMETHFLKPNQEATLSLYNGTFEKSENIITRDRITDASFVARGERVMINPDQWEDLDSTITRLTFTTGVAGTYVAGVSTKDKNIALKADDFNSYLKHDGVVDMLEQRTATNTLDQDAVENYQKHVKAIYQVGDVKTDDWKTVLGYPLEFVPQANPYDKYSGGKLEVKLLLDSQPLSNQIVYADYIQNTITHTHDGTTHTHGNAAEDHTHTSGQQLRTNDQGVVVVDLPEEGIYYLRTIHMVNVTDSEELTHRSKWATLTFEVTHEHGKDTHTHGHEEGIPTWGFVAGSLLIIGLLFFVFRKKDT